VHIVLLLLLPIVAAHCGRTTRFDSPEDRLRWLWAGYKSNYLNPHGYVTDPLRDGLVTSEAQSYALLQAVWLRDRETFDRVRLWTDAHLRREDGLHSWLWDPHGAGRLVDRNSATDADVDIAFALAAAAFVFAEAEYAHDARLLIQSIRRGSTLQVGNGWFPAAGNWAVGERVTNLSYFAPYAYEYFERLDPDAGWREAIDIGYRLLDQSVAGAHPRLPADFVRLRLDGTIEPLPPQSTLSRLFSFDAIRIAWRVDLDCRLFARPRACAPDRLLRSLDLIQHRDGGFFTAYGTDGRVESTAVSSSFYGALLPSFTRHHPAVAAEWRGSFLSDTALDQLRSATNRYYDANWVWFGLASADGFVAARTPRASDLPIH
jgi:hypothetical protein